MFNTRVSSITFATAAMLGAAVAFGPDVARANHTCDPVTDEGWSVVSSHETTGQADSAPYQAGTSGDWFVDRTITVVPFCNYYNPIGIYSMRSYSLDPETGKERIGICRATPQGGSVAVPPYTGACPPK